MNFSFLPATAIKIFQTANAKVERNNNNKR